MKEISIVEPLFVGEFKCTGSDCRDHCCKGWDIFLDKPTVNRYLKSNNNEIRGIAKNQIIVTRNSYNNWGEIKLSEKGRCAFMDEERLCKIHKSMGESALSPTCATYPRIQKRFKYSLRQNLTLSCPEAVIKLISIPDGMLFTEKKVPQAQTFSEADLNQEDSLLNLMCTNLMVKCGVHTEYGFYGIALLFLYFDKLVDASTKHERLEEYFFSVINALENGEIEKQVKNIQADYQLQWALLLRIVGYLSSKNKTRGWTTLQHYVSKLVYIQSEGAKSGDLKQSMQRLDNVWHEKVLPWLSERPHIMSNYIRYRMYNDCFPSNKSISNLNNLYLIVSEWFLLKSLLSACVEMVGRVEEDDIINIIYSYHAVTKHDQVSDKALLQEIEKTKVNDDISLVYLLK